jgi:hypothetical protein
VDGPVLGQHHAGDTGALGRTQQRAEVARVGDTVDGQQERGCTTGALALGQVVDVDLGQLLGLGHDTLGRLCARLGEEAGAGDLAYRHLEVQSEIDDVLEDLVVVLVLGHEDLTNPPLAGQQELPHGLAALDLIAAEAVVAARASHRVAVGDSPATPRPSRPIGLANRLGGVLGPLGLDRLLRRR